MSHPHLLSRESAALLLIDFQEVYRNILFEAERVIKAVRILVEGVKILGLPILVTEQYPKGLGRTLQEVAAAFPEGQEITEKLTLSCCETDVFLRRLRAVGRKQILVAGIETHACVNQTVHDLMASGYQVHAVADATSSRFEKDYRIGWQKLINSGAIPTTVEMALLELLRTAEVPEFKSIQRLIR